MRFAEAPDEVLARLATLRERDAPTHGGHVLSYVYDSGVPALDEVAAAAIRLMQPVNGLDPTTFGSVAALERDLVAFTRDLLGGGQAGDGEAVGTVTSGGTESCLLAVKTARDAWLAARGLAPGAARPRLVAPTTAHAAFHKAAHYFGLELDLVPVRPDGAVAAEAVAGRLGTDGDGGPDDVALVVVSAPSYPHAALDPVADVAAAAAAQGVPVHVDACIGGMALPFWPDLPDWDLRVPGVTSLSVDLHKYGYAPKGVSVLLHRGRDRQRGQYFATTRWPGYPVVNPTMLGSRSGGPLAAAWAITQVLGRDGLATLADRSRQATEALRDAVGQIEGLRVVGHPTGPLLAVASDDAAGAERRVDPHVWADAVTAHGWVLQAQPSHRQPDGTVLPHTTHLTVTPVTASVLDELVPALVAAADEVRGTPRPAPDAALGRLAATGAPPTPPSSQTAATLLAGLGLDTSRIGDDGPGVGPMAPLLAAVEALPAPTAERLLVELLARLVEPR
ncbi:aminotransferase class V-fold PLP-dependent enzyme [Isoptericola halotolerans]|uniref:Glutamate/tyrosine decarboxylase-like PLP-dependent enzyme n=1 Tax=Isoptericola halotolerans TaxID=300560 RepID=A0ABX2A7V9_9MICO|nr:pyridoxal-dependent decarboxylase [Isoptericola halotolerans]NOV98888.1 glutamate/tyrosine decarboxylase-like PLP-dependent enzyme [Isoptericola halotolerans]